MSVPIDLHYNRVVCDRFQHADEAPSAVDRQLHLRGNSLTDKALEMPALAQDSIETRRRNFQCVMTLDRIFDFEYLTDRVTHARAIVHRDAALRIARTTIDENP